MNKPEYFDVVVNNVLFAADNAAIDNVQLPLIQIIRAAVEAALRSGIVNGMLTINPESDWVEWMSMDVRFE